MSGLQPPAEPSVRVHYRDFSPAWHLKALGISAAVLLVCLLASWKIFLP